MSLPPLVAPSVAVARRAPGSPILWVLAFVGSHVLLGVICSQFRVVATLHGVATVAVAFGLALLSKRVDRVLAIAGYCALCDVFWRMTKSAMPWEGAKYLAGAILLIAFFRFVSRPKRISVPIAFLVLLVPSCITAIVVLGPAEARGQISANIAGPALLVISVMMFRQVIASESDVGRFLWVLLGPITAVAAVSTTSTLTAGAIDFGTESNFTTSGGFGPNQVSVMLGLGALICLVLALTRTSASLLVVQIGMGVWFVAQAALTFSRGGLYSLGIAVVAMIVVGLATSGLRSRVLVGVLIGVVVLAAAYPTLNAFTSGSLEERFVDTNTTDREAIAGADFELFTRSPLFGVGVGVSKYERASTSFDVEETKAHTEFTRLLGEHGVLGLTALVLLGSMAVSAVRSASTRWNRLIAAAFVAWPLLTMLHNATGVAAVAFIFGVSQVRLRRDDDLGGAAPPLPAGW